MMEEKSLVQCLREENRLTKGDLLMIDWIIISSITKKPESQALYLGCFIGYSDEFAHNKEEPLKISVHRPIELWPSIPCSEGSLPQMKFSGVHQDYKLPNTAKVYVEPKEIAQALKERRGFEFYAKLFEE